MGTVGIAVDHRRTNASEEQLQQNVARLNNYKEKLILFPRREGKPKKGLINDTTGDRLKTAGNAASPNTLPARSTAPEFAPITKADKEAQVFRTLRILRKAKRYRGRREKRAKDAADKEK